MAADTLEMDDIQGIIARGYGTLPVAKFILLAMPDESGARAWLGGTLAAITPGSQKPDDQALHVAFTATGLRSLGLPGEVLAGFSHEFVEGMTTPHRQRQLGDTGENAPERWRWGGPDSADVHALMLLYARNEETMAPLLAAEVRRAETGGLKVLAILNTSTTLDREPFGFRDGISQPFIAGFGKSGPAVQTVSAGEFMLGYENEYGLLTDRPLVPSADSAASVLPPDAGGSGQRDLGRNGSYLVFRQLEQDVAGFWKHLDAVTKDRRGASNAAAREHLAAKMVGRWRSGAPLVEAPDKDDPALADANDFGYHAQDAEGLRCPVGAHIRRANPRDSLDPNPGTDDSYELNKRHRLLRRGRPYGSRLAAEQVLAGEDGDGDERGIHFICLVGNIARQFEFVQQTWIGNPKFGGLYDDVDPVMGPRGPHGATFTVPAYPVRKRYTGLPSFVTVRGGAYFFLPGIRALRYLAALAGSGTP